MAVAALVAVVPPLLFGGAWSEWIYKGLAILLIGCPCALVISTPAAIAASLSAGARRGLLLKGGAVLEQLGKITVACFDKTGTLTEGKPKVTDVIGFERSEADVLRLAAALETGSSHPLATAILARAAEQTDVGAADFRRQGDRRQRRHRRRSTASKIFLGSPKAAAERAAAHCRPDCPDRGPERRRQDGFACSSWTAGRRRHRHARRAASGRQEAG